MISFKEGRSPGRLRRFGNRRSLFRRMKILLLQLKRIGDLILTTPAIAALRKNLSGCAHHPRGFERMRRTASGHLERRSRSNRATQSAGRRDGFFCRRQEI